MFCMPDGRNSERKVSCMVSFGVRFYLAYLLSARRGCEVARSEHITCSRGSTEGGELAPRLTEEIKHRRELRVISIIL